MNTSGHFRMNSETDVVKSSSRSTIPTNAREFVGAGPQVAVVLLPSCLRATGSHRRGASYVLVNKARTTRTQHRLTVMDTDLGARARAG